jgi:hypothetical protein
MRLLINPSFVLYVIKGDCPPGSSICEKAGKEEKKYPQANIAANIFIPKYIAKKIVIYYTETEVEKLDFFSDYLTAFGDLLTLNLPFRGFSISHTSSSSIFLPISIQRQFSNDCFLWPLL